MTEVLLGKISRVNVGFGGYQDAMFGVEFDLTGKGWGVGDFTGTWATWSEGCKWTLSDQADLFAKTMLFMRDLCQQAGVTDVMQLVGKPVAVTFEDNTLKSWRLLAEVL